VVRPSREAESKDRRMGAKMAGKIKIINKNILPSSAQHILNISSKNYKLRN
jgi:hypothetical protein